MMVVLLVVSVHDAPRAGATTISLINSFMLLCTSRAVSVAHPCVLNYSRVCYGQASSWLYHTISITICLSCDTCTYTDPHAITLIFDDPRLMISSRLRDV